MISIHLTCRQKLIAIHISLFECHTQVTIHLCDVSDVNVAVCNFVVHDRCLSTVVSPCSSVATNLIKVKYIFSCY